MGFSEAAMMLRSSSNVTCMLLRKRDRLLARMPCCCSSFPAEPIARRRRASGALRTWTPEVKHTTDLPLPAGYADMGIAQLEEQATRLKGTVERKRRHPGASGDEGKVDDICAHYERLIAGLEHRIDELQQTQRFCT
mmetsp:Transcript_56001/g.162275  ORF Transcript_56001/g.162275 Transcript_56001/m.162275 type:complete len:137 (+) Transcript_56001:86-496(+)